MDMAGVRKHVAHHTVNLLCVPHGGGLGACMAIRCKKHCMQQGCHAPNPNPTLPCACEQVPIFPPLQSAADFNTAACLALVRAAVGDPAADVSIAGVRTWTMSAQVADRFQVRAPGRGWWGRRGES